MRHLEQAPERLDEPEPRFESYAETEERYHAVLDDTLAGISPFWTRDYDNEQDLAVFKAVHAALKLPAATDAERWRYVMRAVCTLADEYAHLVALGDA